MNLVCLLVSLILLVCHIKGNKPKIVIIGAGPAGIAAATRLVENNFTNVKILEAEHRIGGRINSVKFGDAYVDMGAQWCHGEKKNIVYEKVKDLNLIEHEKGLNKLFHSSRRHISDNFADELMKIITDIDKNLGVTGPDYLTIGEYCTINYNRTITEQFGKNEEKLKIASDGLEYYHQLSLNRDGAFSWFDPAARHDYTECEGDQNQSWKGRGYKTILDVLMKKLPDPRYQLQIDDKIFLNKEVNKIIWNPRLNQNNTKIICSDQSVYIADHVIFTPSIGVLKERGNRLFIPNLPLIKRNAIENLGFGSGVKVWMNFSEPWWPKNVFSMGFIWDEHDWKSAIQEFPLGPHLKGRSWVTYMSWIATEKYNPKVISAWFTGNLVPVIESIPEETIKEGMYYILNKFLGHLYKISKPQKVLQSKWYSNPHFRGTYSFQTLQSCSRKEGLCAEESLAEPLRNNGGRPIVQFAGEATHPIYFSTVHGAIETGYREADVLIDLYKSNNVRFRPQKSDHKQFSRLI